MKHTHTFIILLLLINSFAKAQNLVRNGSFEAIDSLVGCSGSLLDVGDPFPAKYWNGEKGNGTSDHFHNCASSLPQFPDTPLNNTFGSEAPRTGDGMAGMYPFYDYSTSHFNNYIDGTEYLHQELSQALTVGTEYYVEFWVSRSDLKNKATRHLGAYFTDDLNELESQAPPATDGLRYGLHHLTPQIPNVFPAVDVYASKEGWTRISGYYTPTRTGEKYITIGNFDPDANFVILTPGNDHDTTAYYYIDDVYVAERINATLDQTERILCTTGQQATYTVSNIPVNSTLKWTTSSNLAIIGADDQTSITIESLAPNPASEAAWIEVLVDQQVQRFDVWLGRPQLSTPHLTGADEAQEGGSRSWTYDGTVEGATSIQWLPNQNCPPFSFDPCWKVLQSSESSFAHFQVGSNSTNVQMVAQNTCGNRAAIKFVTVVSNDGGCCGVPQMRSGNPGVSEQLSATKVYPNPASDILHIELPDSEYESNVNITLLHAQTGQLIKTLDVDQKVDLDISTLRTGIYILKIQSATQLINKKIIIE